MKAYTRKNLNVKRLLELGDLEIRQIAAQNETLAADEYFAKVEQFIETAPQLKDILVNTSKIYENIKMLKDLEEKLGIKERPLNFIEDTEKISDLENIKEILTQIGYDKLNSDLDSICGVMKSGNLQLVEKMANDVLLKFNALFERTKTAYTLKKFANTSAANDAEITANDPVSLKEALDYLDYEEENRKLRILAVDDVAVILNTITSVLNPYYEVFALKNSSQVEKFLTHTTPELFLLDIEMNEINGFDLVPVIRKFAEHKDTPIIFLTGNASLDNFKDAINLGACDFITKPINVDILLEKIQKNIVRKKAY